MQTITVPVKHLAAALHLAGKTDIRYYLNSVFLDAKSGCIVATDGTCAYISRPGLLVGLVADVLMPREFVEDVVKAAKKAEYAVITEDGGKLSTESCMGRVVDGHFPDWRRIYPSKVSGETAQFDKDLLARVAKANKALGVRFSGGYPLYTSGKDCAIAVLCGGEAHAAVMPLRDTERAPFASFTRFEV